SLNACVGWAKRSVPTTPSNSLDGWWAQRKRAFAHPTRSASPRVDARPLTVRARLRLRHRAHPRHDPVPCLGGIDHLIDLQYRGDRDRLAVGIELGDLRL